MNVRTANKSVMPRSLRNSPNSHRATVLAVVLSLAAIPLLTHEAPFLLMLATTAAIAAIVALSLDLLIGTVGLIAFGHAVWYGMGAYAAGLIAKHLTAEILIIAPLTALATAMAAATIGWILVRQVGKTFAILTLAFSQIMLAAVFVFSGTTGGEDGLQGIPVPKLAGHLLSEPSTFYWLILGVLMVAVWLAFQLRRSPLGRASLAVRDNPERSRFIGLHIHRIKLFAYVSSAVLASIGGCLYSLYMNSVSPDVLHWLESGKILMYVVLGGVGTIIGPAVGAVAFTVLEHYISSWLDAWHIYFGVIFMVVVIVAPGGLYGAFATLFNRIRTDRRA